ncbi:transcriptional regulator, Crp/Fnr family [Denitrovibrio acetiphilus DSM 12809]|uniref:Transcriptional regulator, Crp/Fnr family n=1 Tax=Denitrovibrio acetiphilus (strain DSM 12809 / NBRC 114555 / N2460) TaxID=522772 RepID=D4H604_DENA2|nr:Crp/Fnr family transcriptional regulator [Denitrovibrio acetiphilus]ADD67650.1 transcriptional regulator, Crp/Fnr family [Denitrovibrio acetiphilus DSM 12809]
MTLAERLADLIIFETANERDLERLASFCKVKKFLRDEVVFHKGDVGTDLYAVLSGVFRVVIIDDKGDEIILAPVKPGEVVGEMSMIDGLGRTGTLIADVESEIALIPRKAFNEIMQKDFNVTLYLLETLTERLRKADELIESLAFLNVKERITKYLIESIVKGTEAKDGYFQIKKYTHQELSNLIGASRESVTKCLKILTLEGVVKIKQDCMLIKEPTMIF